MLGKYYTNIGIKDFIKRYGIRNALIRGAFTKFKLHIVPNYEMRKVLWQEKVAKKLRKYISDDKEYVREIKYNDSVCVNNPIWIYWNSGMESAPLIVQSCYKSIVKHAGQEVIVLTDENIDKYVKLPVWMSKKVKKGNLTLAHYTDVIRLALLYRYGGTWIDATVYLSSPLQAEIMDSDFFALRNSFCLLDNPALYAVWFLHAKPNNAIVKKTLNASLAYWSYENHVREYLITNLLLTMIIHITDFDSEILYYNTDYSEYLVKIIGDEYSATKAMWIKSLTNIHKLSYKLDSNVNRNNSFYRHLVEDNF